MARRYFLPAHFYPVDPLRPPGEHSEQPEPGIEQGTNAGARGIGHTCSGRFGFARTGGNWHPDKQPCIVGRSFRGGDIDRACSYQPSAVHCDFSGASNDSRYLAESERGTFRLCFPEAVSSEKSPGADYGTTSGFGPAFSFSAWVNSWRPETICGALVNTVLASFSE